MNGPIDMTETVYALFCYDVAVSIRLTAERGESVDPEALAWAQCWSFEPSKAGDN